MTREITLTQQLQPVANEALTLKVKSHGDLLVATDLLSRLNQLNDKIEAEKQKVLGPLNEARMAEIKRWKPAIKFYEDAIAHVRCEMSAYKTAEIAKQKAKEAKIATDLSTGKIDLDQAVAKIEKIKTPEKEVATTAGLVQFRETKVLKLTDVSLIPREYLVVDEKKVLEALKQGLVVPGAEIETVQTPVNYR